MHKVRWTTTWQLLLLQLVLLQALGGCGGTEPDRGQTFVFGWVLLGFLVLFMLLLFFGLVRYVRTGDRPDQDRPITHEEFVYEELTEDEEED